MIKRDEVVRLLEAHQKELDRWLSRDINNAIALLNAVASGQHDANDDGLHQNVSEVYDLMRDMLFTNAWNSSDSIPDEFWNCEEGQTLLKVRLWLDDDELITVSDAAQIARGSSEQKDLVWIADQIKRGRLQRFTDPNENNPQRATRVSRKQIEQL